MKTIGCLLIVLMIMSVPAFAADLTLFGGYQHDGKITLNSVKGSTSTATAILKNPFNVGVFGLRFGSGKTWGHEETIAYAPNFIDSNSKALIINSNLMLTAPSPVVKPYVTAGAGTFVVRGTGISDIGTKFALNYGGGVKVMPTGPVGIRADVRGYTITGVSGHKLNVFEASLGVNFHF